MIAQELEVSLHNAFMEARQKRHEFITVEHLLLTLLANPSASEVMRSCTADFEGLRKLLADFVTEHTPKLYDDDIDTQPTLGFQKVIQRAILHVQTAGKKEVTGADVLVAIFGEKDSHAVYFMHEKGITRFDVVSYLSHGTGKAPKMESTMGTIDTQSIDRAQTNRAARAPTIHLLMGPGTLPSQGSGRLDFTRYRRSGRPRMTGEELLAALPEIADVACVEVDSGNPYEVSTLEEIRKLALRVNEVLRLPEVDGVVFIQGTNTLEETAYFLTLTVRSAKPVIVTGAQRPFTALSSDAQINLLDAFRVAAAPETSGKGVLVVTNGEINAARDVTKTNTYHVHTFRSRDVGLLGYADADRVVFYRTPTRRHTTGTEFDIETIQSLPRVDILYGYSGAQPGLAEAAVNLGAKGLVMAGIGAGAPGNLTPELALIAASGRAVVVRSSRVGEGRVLRNDNWEEPGMVAADNLSPQKAAVLLSLALTRTSKPEEIQRYFEEY